MMDAREHHGFEVLLGAYALDALDGDERHALEAHLQSCATCQADLVELRRVMAGIGLSVEDVEPPADLKARVVTRATGRTRESPQPSPSLAPHTHGRRASDQVVSSLQPRSDTPVWRLAAAAAVLLAVASGVYSLVLRGQVDDLRATVADAVARAITLAAELDAVRHDSARLTRSVDVLSAPDLLRVDLRGQPGAPGAAGRAFLSPSHGLVFSARQLPLLSSGRVYQLWVIAAGAPVSAGVFTLGPDGIGALTVTLPADLPVPSAVAVTAEPGPVGSKAPTMPILLMGETKPLQPGL